MSLLSIRAIFTSRSPEPGDDGLRQVPVNAETRPSAEQVHLARWGVERIRRRRLRDATPSPQFPSTDGQEL